jgi:hypothetical protein
VGAGTGSEGDKGNAMIVPMIVTPELVELAAAASWNRVAGCTWDAAPELWKPYYRDNMRAGLLAAFNHLLTVKESALSKEDHQ